MSGTRKFYLIVIYCITFSEIHLSSYVAFYGTPKAGNMLKSVRMSCFFSGCYFPFLLLVVGIYFHRKTIIHSLIKLTIRRFTLLVLSGFCPLGFDNKPHAK